MGLLKRVLGDRGARDREFLEFAENVEDQLYRLAYGLCRNRAEAEQYVQDTFVKLLEHWRHLDARRNRNAYAKETLRNLIRNDHRRRTHKGQRIDTVSAEAVGLDFVDLYPQMFEEDKTAEIYVLSALERLTPQQQRVILLRYWADLSVKKIAEWLEISVPTVKTHINDALTKLRPGLVDKEVEQ